ncbi:MAG: radical SAM family heme chaperone HemW [Dysgonamonadaceae bacterium]|jgi:oxygen-independent coproporphyrinogen-3 oxidase|nr:radical SAM family heme chaperone HemW [Dysgonamonadaceae bacterium]
MSGIYFHIPFCRSRCIYCDFFSSTSLKEKELYVDVMCKELMDRKGYLPGQSIQTIYFGGGTPSQLSAQNFEKIFQTIDTCYPEISENKKNLEITLEANPDDLSSEYLNLIKHLPFNRISLGIQSFNDKELRFLRRRHDSESAIRAIKQLQENGFSNISIDLIYGLPGQTLEIWEDNLAKALMLDIQHISAYHLIYEENTPLFQLLKQGLVEPVQEELSVQLFELLIQKLNEAGFEHYEIANFSKQGYRSKHNSSYWDGTHYLGIGASAHSYNGFSRQWNKKTEGPNYREVTKEILTSQMAYNDFIITRLRRVEGIELPELAMLFGEKMKGYCLEQAQKYIKDCLLEIKTNRLKLTKKGLFVSDGIMSALMI